MIGMLGNRFNMTGTFASVTVYFGVTGSKMKKKKPH